MGIRIRPEEIDVPREDPFQNDMLDRKKSAEVLTQLVDGIDGPCVLTIDAPWGTGKTTFLKMWSRHLRNKGFPVVEFNAWETDHAEDPFVAIASELEKGLKEFDEGSFNEKIKDAMEAAKKVVLRAIPALIRVAISSIVDVQALKETGNVLASYAEDRLDRYKEGDKSIKVFQDKLQTMANALVQSKNHPLMVFIDELDRCRPSYAVALIEAAKHLFEADHVVFVLAVNRTQLAHSISALYGSEFDATGYLRRFFDIDFKLPEPDRKLFTKYMLNSILRVESIYLLEMFFGTSNLSLRQIEQAIKRLGIVKSSLRDDQSYIAALVALIVRTIDYDIYEQFVRGKISDKELVDAIYERVGNADREFEFNIAVAAKEIKSKNLNRIYDSQIESPLIDGYDDNMRSDFIKFEEQYQTLFRRMGGFLVAVRLIEYFGKYLNVR